MPTSTPFNIPFIIQAMVSIQPKRILDIGVGTGTYGFLLRQYLDIVPGRLKKTEWTVQIDGMEIFPDYHNPIWDHYYNHILIGDALDLAEEIGTYDVILIADVIEHFEKVDGLTLLRKLAPKARFIVITSPANDYPQGTLYDNVHEQHLSAWREKDFEPYTCFYHRIHTCFIAVIAQKKSDLKGMNFHLPWIVFPFRCPQFNWRRFTRNMIGERGWNKLVSIKRYIKS